MQTYKIVVEWQHRKWGPQFEKMTGKGSSIRRAINSTLREFFSNTSKRKERGDAHAYLLLKAWRMKKPTAAR